MPVDELILDRLRDLLHSQKMEWEEKKMFGGICFMVDDKMCFGTYKGGLMARVDPEQIEEFVKRAGAEQMIHGGRPMTGYAWIKPEGYDLDEDLTFWIRACLDFNPRAKSSKKRKKNKIVASSIFLACSSLGHLIPVKRQYLSKKMRKAKSYITYFIPPGFLSRLLRSCFERKCPSDDPS